MGIQYVAVLVLIAIAASYLLRRAWRTVAGHHDCRSCGCARTRPSANENGYSTLVPIEQVRLRPQRPETIENPLDS